MGWFATIILIALIAVVVGIVASRRGSELEARGRGGDPEKAALRREVSDLKARIATLERIATDRPTRLSHEIEALAETHAETGSDGTDPNMENGTGTADTDKKD
ncbi:hypothetical protein [Pacificimonas flava]|uniref:Uncharacterized protein n=1 Tax=Pacificimonas flava TaxID=1234595 RepID=M2U4P6_9SPHN|nr:hypothetical protein [Pacificimonas flava]EMD82948.1 hypothetical protein C725_1546 [Pacificimonas flava]MBB5280108.1 hypothetical protein [Pacificimonas flava]